MANFMKSKSLGSFGERTVHNYLTLAGIECEFNKDKDKRSEYDLLCRIGKKEFTIEVKLDLMSSRTGNLAIEYQNEKTGLPSGLLISKADVWAILTRDEENWVVFLCKTADLKRYTDSHKVRTIIGAGDGNANLWLHPMVDILSIFTRIDNLHIEDLKKVIKGLLK